MRIAISEKRGSG